MSATGPSPNPGRASRPMSQPIRFTPPTCGDAGRRGACGIGMAVPPGQISTPRSPSEPYPRRHIGWTRRGDRASIPTRPRVRENVCDDVDSAATVEPVRDRRGGGPTGGRVAALTRSPGWYPNSDGPGKRWHDGRRWTGVTRLDPAAAQAAVRVASRRMARQRRGLRLRLVLLGTLVASAVAGIAMLLPNSPAGTMAEGLGFTHRHRLLPPAATRTGSLNYTISKTDLAGRPVTYDPCHPIDYVINPAGAPADYLLFIKPAIKAAQQAAGLKFVYRGTTTDTFDSRRQRSPTRQPVVIAFPAALQGTESTGDAVGLGGSTAITVNGAVQPHYVTGAIALRSSWFKRESALGHTVAEQGIVMHELGHLLGLGHVQDPSQLMYPAYHDQASYGLGDLAGLAVLGEGTC